MGSHTSKLRYMSVRKIILRRVPLDTQCTRTKRHQEVQFRLTHYVYTSRQRNNVLWQKTCRMISRGHFVYCYPWHIIVHL